MTKKKMDSFNIQPYFIMIMVLFLGPRSEHDRVVSFRRPPAGVPSRGFINETVDVLEEQSSQVVDSGVCVI